jgi:large subunit ribosomal protein L15
MPLQKRVPKIGFFSRVVKPYSINVDKVKKVANLDEITMETIRSVYKLSKDVSKVKLIGSTVKDIASKIKDENVTTTGK